MASNDDFGARLGEWCDLVRRARMGRDLKFAALLLASYANNDGAGIFAGITRLALDLEVSNKTAERRLKMLRDMGLIEHAQRGNRRRGMADEYRLIIGPNVLDHVDVPSPTAYKRMVDETRPTRRRGADYPSPMGDGYTGSDGGPPAPDYPSPRMTVKPAFNRHLERDYTSPMGVCPPELPPPQTYNLPSTTEDDLRTAVTGPRATPGCDRCVNGFVFNGDEPPTYCTHCRNGESE